MSLNSSADGSKSRDISSDTEESPNRPRELPAELITIEDEHPGCPGSSRRRSKIYDHFIWIPQKNYWKCKYCPNIYHKPKHGGTGALNNHMSRAHPAKLKQSKTGQISSHFTTIDKGTESVQPSIFSREEFERKLVKFIVCTNQPFSLVDEIEFNELIKYVSQHNPLATLPERHTMKKLISSTFKLEKETFKSILSKTDAKVSVTVDCWTSTNQQAFQGVTISWIDESWQLQNAVIDLSQLEGSHTGENLANELSTVFEDFGLWSKLLAVTTDNASNMGTMFSELDSIAQQKKSTFTSENYRIRCMAHIINLACQATISTIDGEFDQSADLMELEISECLASNSEQLPEVEIRNNPVKKVRKAVVAIRGSPQRREMLFKQCEVSNLDAKNLIRDVPTRWNSTLNMLERALELRQPLELTLQAYKKLRHLILTENEWDVVTTLVKLLRPFRDATLLLSKQSVPTLSNTTAVYEVLFEHLEAYLPGDITNTPYRRRQQAVQQHPEWLQKAAQAGWNKLKTYYPSADGLSYIVATILDPRYKDKWYSAVGWNRDWITSCKKTLKSVWNSTYKSTNDKQPIDEPSTQSKMSDLESKIFNQMQSVQRNTTADELTKYLQESVVLNDMVDKEKSGIDGVLGWWKIHQQEYPNLSKMARDFLSISGTGVPVERFFSTGTDLIGQRRHRLSAESIKECMCLKNWLRHDNSLEELKNSVLIKVLGYVTDT